MTSELPKPEYPRPDLDRSSKWLSLNGQWDFESEYGKSIITVPFAWETKASRVERNWLENARYHRAFTVPESWRDSRVFVCFGAAHYRAQVAINDVHIGTHEGGYSSFEFDVTENVSPGANVSISVDVYAPSDKRQIAHGKQRSIPRDDYDGVCFTPTSGIWQSVWLEARGRTYVSQITLRGDSLLGFDVRVDVAGDNQLGEAVTLELLNGRGEKITLITNELGFAAGHFAIENPRLWSPTDPYLYELRVTTEGGDELIASGGLRSFKAIGEQLFLNGERIFLRGVLDQGYWPNNGATAPNEEALLKDLELARASGFNLIRKHLKFEEPRWLYLADKLGILVWAEPASTSRFSNESVANFNEQIQDMVNRDGNHPCIVIWGLYNEEWGLDWDIPGDVAKAEAASLAYDLLIGLDNSRPIVENSGWAHVKTDLVDWHYYDDNPKSWNTVVADLANGNSSTFPVRLGPSYTVEKGLYANDEVPRSGIPLINSEYGGGFTSLERAWHLRWQTQELRRHDKFSGYVYTELTDVEHECAGIFNCERGSKDLGGLNIFDVNSETVLIMDLIPSQAGTDIPMPAKEFEIGIRVSHHGSDSISGKIRGRWDSSGSVNGAFSPNYQFESSFVRVAPFKVTDPVSVRISPPESDKSARLHFWLVGDEGKIFARNFLDAGPIEII